ncbi:unnamed protein product [Ambrosiozyma monospora]|uniref:Unnamed protein product n=1 Tax=Ambrosiozyma monospora TaxID=43982 RepID=A0ACB5U411_AMBMO|nr:unnamed protein product [Ambrosiozyma monospora]
MNDSDNSENVADEITFDYKAIEKENKTVHEMESGSIDDKNKSIVQIPSSQSATLVKGKAIPSSPIIQDPTELQNSGNYGNIGSAVSVSSDSDLDGSSDIFISCPTQPYKSSLKNFNFDSLPKMKPIKPIDKVSTKPVTSNSQMGPPWLSQLDQSESQVSGSLKEPQAQEEEHGVEFDAEPDVQSHFHSEVVPSSQPEDDQEEDEIDHVLPAGFFDKYKTDQLRRQIDSWGLKRVKSKKAMISLLTVTSKLMKLEDLSDAYNRFKVKVQWLFWQR